MSSAKYWSNNLGIMIVALTYPFAVLKLYQMHHINASKTDVSNISDSFHSSQLNRHYVLIRMITYMIMVQTCGCIRNDESRCQDLCKNEKVVSNFLVSCGHRCVIDSKYKFVNNKKTAMSVIEYLYQSYRKYTVHYSGMIK